MKPCPLSVTCMSSRKMGCQSPSPFPAAVSSVSRLSIVKVDQPSWSMSLHVYMTLIQNPRRFFGNFHQVTGPATSTLPGKKQGTAKFDYVQISWFSTRVLCFPGTFGPGNQQHLLPGSSHRILWVPAAPVSPVAPLSGEASLAQSPTAP